MTEFVRNGKGQTIGSIVKNEKLGTAVVRDHSGKVVGRSDDRYGSNGATFDSKGRVTRWCADPGSLLNDCDD